jgi:hypothetical protein
MTINLSKFKPRVHVDWLRISFITSTRSNLKTVQPILNRILNLQEGRRASIDLLDETAGGSVSHFGFRMQDPECGAAIRHVIEELQRRFRLAAEPKITGIEVSLDLFGRKGTTTEELAEATAHLYNYSAYHPNANRRMYGPDKHSTCEVTSHRSAMVREILDGRCIAVGSQRDHINKLGHQLADPISSRYYLKRTDDGGSELNIAKHSARSERTFQGEGLPFSSLEELEGFDFTSLMKFFSFRKLKDDLISVVRASHSDKHVHASFQDEEKARTAGGGIVKHNRATAADSELNAAVARALRALTKRWKKPYLS